MRKIRFLQRIHPKKESGALHYERATGKFFWLQQRLVQASSQEAQPRIVALDPGIASFLTLYSPTDLRYGKFNKGIQEEAWKRLRGIDRLDRKFRANRMLHLAPILPFNQELKSL